MKPSGATITCSFRGRTNSQYIRPYQTSPSRRGNSIHKWPGPGRGLEKTYLASSHCGRRLEASGSGILKLRYDVGGWTNSAWSPDGTTVAIVSQDTVKVLPAWESLEDLLAYARECCVVRELTDAEREQFGLTPR